MTATTPGQRSFEPRLWWETKRKRKFFGASGGASSAPPSRARRELLAELRSALLASLGQYTAAVQYTDCFLPQYFDTDWVSQCLALYSTLLLL